MPAHECDICYKKFKLKDTLKEHRSIHFDEMRFSCDQCDYMNNDYSSMSKHRRAKHPNAPVLPPGTGKSFLRVRTKQWSF